MNKRNEDSPVNRYRQLARRIGVVRGIVPVVLFVVVCGVEASEHIIREGGRDILDFLLEVSLFGVIGPAVVAGVLTWIINNLELLAQAYERIETFNVELEQKIQVRTAELETANRDLRQLDRLKSEFVSLVSHELRTPLTNIRGGLEIVMAEPMVTCSSVTRDTLTIVQVETNRLIRLVQRILDVSAFESGQLKLNCGPIAIRPLIHRLAKDSLLLDAAHPLHLDMPTEPLLVFADEERLTDILTNLLSNAIKYSPGEHPIVIRLARWGDMAQITIKDYGLGIAPEEQPYVIQRFYRCRAHRDIPGYGLGLYFSNKLVEAQGGRLWVESKGIPGEGSEFHFTLPIDKEIGDGADPADR